MSRQRIQSTTTQRAQAQAEQGAGQSRQHMLLHLRQTNRLHTEVT